MEVAFDSITLTRGEGSGLKVSVYKRVSDVDRKPGISEHREFYFTRERDLLDWLTQALGGVTIS